MTQHQQPATEIADDSAVERYLIDNPDFFVSRVHLLADLQLPHKNGSAVSLVERQVALLREQNQRSQSQLQQLIQIARDNDRLNDHLQRLTLSLMETEDLNESLVLLNTVLKNDFDAEAIVLHLIMDEASLSLNRDDFFFMDIEFIALDSPLLQVFAEPLKKGKAVCGRFTNEQRAMMFGALADEVASAVMVPMAFRMSYAPERPLIGVMVIGSQDPDRYHYDVGTTFLAYLGELIGRKLKPYVTA